MSEFPRIPSARPSGAVAPPHPATRLKRKRRRAPEEDAHSEAVPAEDKTAEDENEGPETDGPARIDIRV